MSDQNFQKYSINNTAQSEVAMQTNYKPYIYTAIFAIIAVGGFGYYLMPEKYVYQPNSVLEDVSNASSTPVITQPVTPQNPNPVTNPTPTPEPIACTMDALMCPDGSYVGRSGPNCQFVCPKFPDPQENTLNNPDFSLRYDSRIFAEVPTTRSLPPKYTESYKGTMLMLASRVGQLGQEKCSYGESDMISKCSPENEFGFSFGVVEKSVPDLTDDLDDSLKRKEVIAGKESISWAMGVEGYSFTYYFVPLRLNKTLVITEYHYYDSYSPIVTYPTIAQFDEIISTLKLY